MRNRDKVVKIPKNSADLYRNIKVETGVSDVSSSGSD